MTGPPPCRGHADAGGWDGPPGRDDDGVGCRRSNHGRPHRGRAGRRVDPGRVPDLRPAARAPRRGPHQPSPSRRRPGHSPWPGRIVTALVALAAVVAAVVVLGRGSSPSSHSPAAIQRRCDAGVHRHPDRTVSVFHLERDADDAARVGYTHDGNPATVWTTDRYYGPHFAGLRHGLGLAITLDGSHRLHQLVVQSPTRGWSAQVYVAPAVPGQVSLAAWGQPVATKQGIDGSVTFDLGNHTGGAVLLWITDLGPANQAGVAELTVS